MGHSVSDFFFSTDDYFFVVYDRVILPWCHYFTVFYHVINVFNNSRIIQDALQC